MAHWFNETNLSRFNIRQIGIAFYIREIMKNSMNATPDELRETFGYEWREDINLLALEGIVNVKFTRRMVFLKVVSRGDTRRDKMRIAAMTNRKQQKGQS